jgi:hypothetical protein
MGVRDVEEQLATREEDVRAVLAMLTPRNAVKPVPDEPLIVGVRGRL